MDWEGKLCCFACSLDHSEELPGQLSATPWRRELMRVALCSLFLVAYGPSLFREAKKSLRMATDYRMVIHAPSDLGDEQAASNFDRRLGFPPNLDNQCCSANKFTFGELKDIVEEVRATASSRPTFVDGAPFGDGRRLPVRRFAEVLERINNDKPR